MTLVRRRVVNPAPAVLALINPKKKRGKTMATRKRKGGRRRVSRARSRNPVNPVNPTRRRRSTRRRGRRSTVYARRRNPINPVNPTRRRRRGRRRSVRRNPVTGTLGRALPIVGASVLIGASTQFVAPVVARFAPQLVATPIGIAATTFGTGWALSMVARAFSFTRRWADDVMLAGAILAGGQLASAYVVPRLGLGGQGGNGMGRRRDNGLRGIGIMPGVPPGIPLMPPAAPANGNQGMQGIGVYPGITSGR